ncbi:MAG: hypothetical protein AAFQ37_05480, partial [Bacteroidota bacterium]
NPINGQILGASLEGDVWDFDVSPNGNQLACISSKDQVTIYSISDGALSEIGSIQVPPSSVFEDLLSISYLSNNQLLLADPIGYGIWDKNGNQIAYFPGINIRWFIENQSSDNSDVKFVGIGLDKVYLLDETGFSFHSIVKSAPYNDGSLLGDRLYLTSIYGIETWQFNRPLPEGFAKARL